MYLIFSNKFQSFMTGILVINVKFYDLVFPPVFTELYSFIQICSLVFLSIGSFSGKTFSIPIIDILFVEWPGRAKCLPQGLFLSLFSASVWCSENLFLRGLPVSPMYDHVGHLLQEILYMTQALCNLRYDWALSRVIFYYK